ncbi:helix-turn-helix domain-containing protein [Bosea sp. CS1GBMeth4]|uniref:helix-turn-helix domain-containing protein n=1 Tax=Bosea sp. CS1GBMeth4 TaxID=1892849 RepID=UPI001FCE4066|nr:helix-turn-helix domain-containing protein [Bosea sp. CS1GBMeth4]
MNKLIAKRSDAMHRRAVARLAEAAACGALRVPAAALRRERGGTRSVAFARQMAMYLAHVVFGLTMTQVGCCFERDRTTVRHACALIEDRRDRPAFDLAVGALEAGLMSLALGFEAEPLVEMAR